MLTLVRRQADKSVWLADGMFARKLGDEELADLLYLAKHGVITLWRGGEIWEGLVAAHGIPVDSTGQPVAVDYDRIEDAIRDAVADLGEGGAAKVRADEE